MVNSSGQPLHDSISLYLQLMFSASGQPSAGAPLIPWLSDLLSAAPLPGPGLRLSASPAAGTRWVLQPFVAEAASFLTSIPEFYESLECRLELLSLRLGLYTRTLDPAWLP